jgi:hypothetical protein
VPVTEGQAAPRRMRECQAKRGSREEDPGRAPRRASRSRGHRHESPAAPDPASGGAGSSRSQCGAQQQAQDGLRRPDRGRDPHTRALTTQFQRLYGSVAERATAWGVRARPTSPRRATADALHPGPSGLQCALPVGHAGEATTSGLNRVASDSAPQQQASARDARRQVAAHGDIQDDNQAAQMTASPDPYSPRGFPGR